MTGAGAHRPPGVPTIRPRCKRRSAVTSRTRLVHGPVPSFVDSKILVDACYFNGPQLGEESEAALFVRRVCPVPFAFIT